MNIRERIGENMKKYRKSCHLTYREVAQRVGKTSPTIQGYEKGNIKTLDIEMLEKIANVLGVTIGQLIEEKTFNTADSQIVVKLHHLSEEAKGRILNQIDYELKHSK